MNYTTEQNKEIVLRFNREVIEQGNFDSFKELVSEKIINHAAVPGASSGAEGMTHFLQNILQKGFPDLKVQILEQVAERDLVTTHKAITATHKGEILGIPASNKKVRINVIDIIRLKDGKYVEHWAVSNFSEVIAQISSR